MGDSLRHHLPFIAAGQAQKELTHNEAVALIDVALHASAEGLGLNTPPLAPGLGQCWIVGAAPTGEWTGQAQAIACWTESGWRFLAAREGMRVWLIDQQCWAERTGSGWAAGDVRGIRVMIDDVQVVGARLGAVAPPSGGAVVDVEARATVTALIDRLQSHGLIDV
ncbi:DUF2793 domain-containing protein [Sphingomonas sp. ID1715]|uniref:DUF2793 domain-containing protein n=1 Tax=Sphingomonas sp. ID1715 TaxID=1656898 RepID=UPI0014883908|nr:DUF2793 domain-containing protein [Sphingomonas sp. ID1715]NNM76642.1 DUF2793 domain-containing protein [Sphingomonas sp. ID1715]